LPGADGLHQFSETTDLMDTPANRVLLSKHVAMIGADIQAGRFNYLSWFPNGSRAGAFRIQIVPAAAKISRSPTIGDYFLIWVAGKVPPIVRATRARDYRNHFAGTFCPSSRILCLPSCRRETSKT
jgi:Arm domain-containing DNA-binding protein